MRILIVGNDPAEIGGVANYTRPLATRLSELGHEVHYLYSGAYRSTYDLSFRPHLKEQQGDFPFKCAEIVNSPCLPFNFGFPELDLETPALDLLLSRYLDRVKPDVMHVHSRFGLPVSLNRIGSGKGIVVVNTVHVYGYLCQKRVMIDHEGMPCPGPGDLEKCAACTGEIDYTRERLRAVLRNYNKALKVKSPVLFRVLQLLKGALQSAPSTQHAAQERGAAAPPVHGLSRRLADRLAYCVETLNLHCDRTICVSSDVKATLERYGVEENRLMVQHIGSVIAERQTMRHRPLHQPLVIGNIGGVNYYKGTHVLMEAISRLRGGHFVVKIFGKYSEEYVADLKERFPALPVEFTGRYAPQDLPDILKQIDVMVLPSICNDTAPQTIFESFSGGVPIIASCIGGFPDFVEHGVNGLLFEPGDSGDLAASIGRILAQPQLLAEFRRNVPRLKTIDENARELVTLYGELAEISSSLSAPPAACAR